MGKCPFGEVSITDVSSRGIVQSGISPSGRCLSGNVSWGSVLGEVLVGELSSRETVLQSSNRTSIKIMFMTVITVSWKEEGSEYCQKIRYWCLRHVTCKIALGTSKFDRFREVSVRKCQLGICPWGSVSWGAVQSGNCPTIF